MEFQNSVSVLPESCGSLHSRTASTLSQKLKPYKSPGGAEPS